MRLLIISLACLLSFMARAQETPSLVEPDTELPVEAVAPDTVTIFTVVEKNAEFAGGFAAMIAYLGQNIRYPEE